jgi:hypothetical protein
MGFLPLPIEWDAPSHPRFGRTPRAPKGPGLAADMKTSTTDRTVRAASGVQRLSTAWCAVGGERGGDIVPRWFSSLGDLGIREAHLFWALPESAYAALALDQLRSVSNRWLEALTDSGIAGELSIKRGAPGPWLTALAELSEESLIVCGPPAWRGTRSTTLEYLAVHARRPLVLLPDLVQTPEIPILSRIVVDATSPEEADRAVLPLGDGARTVERLDLGSLEPAAASRILLRISEDVDASLLVLPRRAGELGPLVLEHGNFPLFVPAPRNAGA